MITLKNGNSRTHSFEEVGFKIAGYEDQQQRFTAQLKHVGNSICSDFREAKELFYSNLLDSSDYYFLLRQLKSIFDRKLNLISPLVDTEDILAEIAKHKIV